MTLFKIVFFTVFFAVLASLFTGVFFLTTDKDGEQKRTLKALTLRIILSIVVIVLLVIGYFTGLIQPQIR